MKNKIIGNFTSGSPFHSRSRGLIIEVKERPLVTFAIFGYNQEHFIREAIEGALWQTYSPMEIILSDDSSNDGTFRVMTEMADSYKGPHSVILNRNPSNLNVSRHVNHVVAISNGEILITAGGDDISLPNRAALTADLFSRRPEATSCISFVREFGAINRTTLFFPPDVRLTTIEACLRHEPSVGAACAYRRSLFEQFPPLSENPPMEDTTLQFRSLLAGVYALVPEVTVRYRRGHSYFADEEKVLKYLHMMFHQFEQDLIHYCKAKKKDPYYCLAALSLRRNLVLGQYRGTRPSKLLARFAFKLMRLARYSTSQRHFMRKCYRHFIGDPQKTEFKAF